MSNEINAPQEKTLPTKFGDYGGQFVPETLVPALAELESAYLHYRDDAEFQAEFNHLLETYVGRPTPLTFAARLTEQCGGARIYLKREDLAHSGAHKINNALGQALISQTDGQTARHRRDRGRAAWGRLSHSLRLAGAGLCGLYGHR